VQVLADHVGPGGYFRAADVGHSPRWRAERELDELVGDVGRVDRLAEERYDTKLWMRDLKEGAAYLPK
jgi:hypothetical protein